MSWRCVGGDDNLDAPLPNDCSFHRRSRSETILAALISAGWLPGLLLWQQGGSENLLQAGHAVRQRLRPQPWSIYPKSPEDHG
jgi:hypothetical protein